MGWAGLQMQLQHATGVEIQVAADGTFLIRVVTVSRAQQQVFITQKQEFKIKGEDDKTNGASSLSLLKKQLNTIAFKHPIVLTLTGKGILIKKTVRLNSLNLQSIQQVFPAYQAEAYYLQHFQSGELSYLAFIRKELTDPILEAFHNQGTPVLSLSLGPFVVNPVIDQLNCYDAFLNFDGHQIVLTMEKDWQDYTYLPGVMSSYPLKIDIESIAEQFVLAYATAFQLLLHDRLEMIAVPLPALNDALQEYMAKLKFEQGGKLLFLGSFVLLFLNFLLLTYYQSTNQELLTKAGARSNLFADKEQLTADLKEKELQVKQIGWNQGYSYAYLCDQIGQTLPPGILLTVLKINEMQEPGTGLAKKTPAETGHISITGTSPGIYQINDWMYALQQKAWVKKVRLEAYTKDQQQGTEVFTLTLNY